MKIVLLGKEGLLGQYFNDLLSNNSYRLFSFNHSELDVLDFEKVENKLSEIKPDICINCTAYTNVDKAEEDDKLAYGLNYEAVKNLAKVCKSTKVKLIHFSTDYVFFGDNPYGYSEIDKAIPVNVYGSSKLAGENAIIDIMDDNYFIVRTAWLFGKNSKNFVNTMLELSKKKGVLKVVSDQIGSPTYAKDLANKVILEFIKSNNKAGIYHLTNSKSCSWYEFAKSIFDYMERSVELVMIDSQELNRAANRPKYSILKNTKLKPMRSWQEGLTDYLDRCLKKNLL